MIDVLICSHQTSYRKSDEDVLTLGTIYTSHIFNIRLSPKLTEPITRSQNSNHNQSTNPISTQIHLRVLSKPANISNSQMAGQILLKTNQVSISHIGLGIGTLLLSAFALFMCANHSRRWTRKWRSCYGYGYPEPVIQLNPRDIPTSHFGELDLSTSSGEYVSVWKKNILMGGKCQLPEFSGVIIYDSAGNVVTPAKANKARPPLPCK